MLVEISLLVILEISFNPFVSSSNPDIIPSENFEGAPKALSKGDIKLLNNFIIPLLFKIDIISPNNNINPAYNYNVMNSIQNAIS